MKERKIMEFHLFVKRERENLFLTRQISARRRGAVIPRFIGELSCFRSKNREIFGFPFPKLEKFLDRHSMATRFSIVACFMILFGTFDFVSGGINSLYRSFQSSV